MDALTIGELKFERGEEDAAWNEVQAILARAEKVATLAHQHARAARAAGNRELKRAALAAETAARDIAGEASDAFCKWYHGPDDGTPGYSCA